MLLVGGFIMLRFINPALLTPDFYSIVPSLSIGDRRNLTLLCKIIQNISNQTLCNEQSMLDCNPFIEKNMNRLEDFYNHVLMDPCQETGELKNNFFFLLHKSLHYAGSFFLGKWIFISKEN